MSAMTIDPYLPLGGIDFDMDPMAEVFDLAERRAAKKAAKGKGGASTSTSNTKSPDGVDWEAFLPVFSANIGRGVTQAQAKANINRVFRESLIRQHRALIGFQEIDEADAAKEHQILSTHVRKGSVTAHAEHEAVLKHQRQTYRFAGFSQTEPIAIPSPWVIEDVIVTLTCQGRAKVTPHRVCVQAICSHPAMPGYQVAFLNGHYPLARLGAQDLWDDCHGKWQDITKGYMLRGIPVVTTRDTNAVRMSKLVKSEKQLLPQAINKISLCMPENSELQIKKTGAVKVINLNIDGHDAKGVGLKFWVPSHARPLHDSSKPLHDSSRDS